MNGFVAINGGVSIFIFIFIFFYLISFVYIRTFGGSIFFMSENIERLLKVFFFSPDGRKRGR